MTKEIQVAIFDFDGTLRDGLAEKVWAFDMARKVMARMWGLDLREYTTEDMRYYAGVPVGEIAVKIWGDKIPAANLKEFENEYAEVWKDIYAYYDRIERGNTQTVEPKTAFTEEEQDSIQKGMPKAAWFDGAQDLLRSLHAQGIFTGVLSNTPTIKSLEAEVASGGVLAAVDDVFTGSPFGVGKPKPEALFHGLAMAWAKKFDQNLFDSFSEATRNLDAPKHNKLLTEILQSMKEKDFQMDVLMVGDGKPDLEVANETTKLLESLGLDQKIRVQSLALTYGFQQTEDLAKLAPSDWGHGPREMAAQVQEWAKTGTMHPIPQTPSAKAQKAPGPQHKPA